MTSTIQFIVGLRPSTAARRLVLVVVGIFILALWNPGGSPSTSRLNRTSQAGEFLHGHPIESLIIEKRSHFAQMLERQSKTLEQAIDEYERRYGRRPPAGFDKWFALAQQNNFILVDEFDTFMASMEPFHGIHPSIIQQRIDAVMSQQRIDAEKKFPNVFDSICVVKYSDGNLTISEKHGLVGTMLANTTWTEIVPYNVTFLLNVHDQARVNSPWEEVQKAVKDARDPTSERYTKEVKHSHQTSFSGFVEIETQIGWAVTQQACPIHSPARQNTCLETTFKSPLSFINNASQSLDVCQNCELKTQQSILIQHGYLQLARELTPIWSASKQSHFHDILYPSAYYIATRGDYQPQSDKPWAEKDSKIYWVGRATGGRVTEDVWDRYPRARFVLKTSPKNTEAIQLLDEETPNSDRWVPRYSTMAEIHDLFATRMAAVVQCPEDVCKIQEQAFDIRPELKPDPQEAAYAYKFVVDIDGNGFSGRYYRLLQSKSVVIKSTILKEWHDDFLVPWVHYVPLSSGYLELPELARFLASTKRGLELSERIAAESTEWHNKALRDVDLQLVWLRMVLEFGRVMQPNLTL